jgi:hypothetical protein
LEGKEMALLPDAFHIELGDAIKLSRGDTWACASVGGELGRTVKMFFESCDHMIAFAEQLKETAAKGKEASNGPQQ